ncbi:type II secretion system F family protein [Nonlabens xiamenensis]|uniref:type II secretion system F family protein n=1 Tax=Nonlabens xiamenensis TaxID=2341043 RepID=UPI000F6105CD|nr:type II secretion system F family protein [Nonlabens xiamenensis]
MAFDLSKITKSDPDISTKEDGQSIWEREIFSFTPTFSKKIKETFYLELGILLDSGIPLKQALDLVAQGLKKKKPKEVLQKISDRLVQGSTLSAGFKEHNVFTNYEVRSIKIGEETGRLTEVIKSLADYYKQHNEQKKELLNALTYPIIVLITAVVVVYFMLNFVVPIFQDLFKRNNTELPWITEMVIKASELLNQYGLLALALLVAGLIARRLLAKNKTYQKWKGLIIIKVPYIGTLTTRSYINQFINAMSLLSSAKINVTHALKLISNMIPYYPLNAALEQINRDLINGDSQSEAFKKHPKLFDNKLIAMIQVAEQTNQDELVYQNLKLHYNNLLKQQAKTFTNLINPILTLLVGCIVGFILIALYLPMFKMSTLIG